MKVIIGGSSCNSIVVACPSDDFCGCYAAGDYDGDGCDCVEFNIN